MWLHSRCFGFDSVRENNDKHSLLTGWRSGDKTRQPASTATRQEPPTPENLENSSHRLRFIKPHLRLHHALRHPRLTRTLHEDRVSSRATLLLTSPSARDPYDGGSPAQTSGRSCGSSRMHQFMQAPANSFVLDPLEALMHTRLPESWYLRCRSEHSRVYAYTIHMPFVACQLSDRNSI